MLNHRREDRQRHDRQIWQSFTVTTAGVWLTILLWVWMIAPIFGPGIWPLLELPFSTSGRKAPVVEHDMFVSIRADGSLFLDDVATTPALLARQLAERHHSNDGRQHEREVFVRVDKAAPFSAVRKVIRAAQSAGRARVVFLAATRDAL